MGLPLRTKPEKLDGAPGSEERRKFVGGEIGDSGGRRIGGIHVDDDHAAHPEATCHHMEVMSVVPFLCSLFWILILCLGII